MNNDILQNIFYALSNRDLASITIIGVFSIYFMSFKSIRQGTFQIIKTTLSPKIIIPYSLQILCIIFACYILHLVGMWRTEYLKDVIYYSVAAFPLLWQVIKFSSQQDFSNLLLKQVKFSALMSAYLNIYTFGYIAELVLQTFFVVSVFITLEIQRNQKNVSSIKLLGCIDKSKVILGIGIFIFVLYKTFTQSTILIMEGFLQSVALPIILTIAIIPYLYLVTIYSTYEVWFVRLYWSVGKNKEECKLRKKILFHACGLNLHKIRYFEKHIKLFMLESNTEFTSAVQQCNIDYSNFKVTI